MKNTIMVCSVSLSDKDALASATHDQMWYRNGRYAERHGLMFLFFTPKRQSIDSARNAAASIAVANGCSHVFYYDDDMVLSPNTLIRLYNRKKDGVQASSVIRGQPYNMMFFKRISRQEKQRQLEKQDPSFKRELPEGRYLDFFDDYEEYIDEDGLVEVEAMGNCATLYKTELFTKVSEPWFHTAKNCTEDVYFCCKAKDELGDEGARFYVDTTLDTGHLLDRPVLRPSNRHQFQAIAKQYPGVLP